MLVLTRKKGEKVYIGDDVCVCIVDIDRNKVRLGIEAPRDVPVLRSELVPVGDWQGAYGDDVPPGAA